MNEISRVRKSLQCASAQCIVERRSNITRKDEYNQNIGSELNIGIM